MSFSLRSFLLKTKIIIVLLLIELSVFAQKDSFNLYNLSLEELMNIDVFSASKKNQKLMEAPAIMTVISKVEIENMGVTTLIDVLKYVPGVETSLASDGSYRLSIRGNRKDGNILLLVNGQQMNDFYSGRAVFDLPIAMIEKIEFIRGPGSALFGSNAVAGVINLFLPEETAIQVLGGINQIVGGHIQYLYDKNDCKLAIRSGYQQGNTGSANIETDASDSPGNTWDLSYDSLKFKTHRSSEDAYLNINLDIKKFKFYSNTLRHVYSDWAGAQFVVAPSSEFKLSQNNFGLSYEYQVNETIKLIPKVYTSTISRNNLFQETPKGYVSNLSGDLFPEGRQTKESYTAQTYGAELDLYIKLNEHLNLLTGNIFEDLILRNYDISRNYMIVGDQYQANFGNYDQIDPLQNNKRRFVFAYFLQADYNWKKLNMTLGFRYDDYSDFGSSFNPRLGLNYHLTDKLRIKGLIGKAFRAPTFQELYDNTTLGNQYGVKGNQTLHPEIIKTYELGMEYQRKNLLLRYNGYFNQNNHLIKVYDPHGGGSIGEFQNIGSTKTVGHEIELICDVTKKLQFFANASQFLSLFSWNEANVTKADVIFFSNEDPYYKQMLNIPTIRVNAGMNLTMNRFKFFAGLNYGNAASNNHRFYLEKGSYVQIPSYVLGNAMLTYQLSSRLNLKLSVNNIGQKYVDADESTNIDVYGNKGLIQPGMNGIMSVLFKLH